MSTKKPNSKDKKDKKEKVVSDSNTKILGFDIGSQVDKRVLNWSAVIGAEIFVFLVIIFAVVQPRLAELKKLRKEIARQKALAAALESKLEQLEDFERRYGDETLTEDVFPRFKDVGLLLTSLKQLAIDTGVEVKGYDLSPGSLGVGENATSRNAQDSFDIEVSVSGSPSLVQQFLTKVNESVPLKRIDSLEVTKGSIVSNDVGQESLIMEAKLLIASFYQNTEIVVDPKGKLESLDDRDELAGVLEGYLRPRFTQGEDVPTGNPNLFGL